MPKKIGFGAVLALVFGSQIGSGIFVLPALLAPFGWFGIYGWCFAGLGAMSLAFVFAELCSRLPKTGGPHVYIKQVFGSDVAFFVGWTYWLVSWISSAVLVVMTFACLRPFGVDTPSTFQYLMAEICLLTVLAFINCKSVELSGRIEFVLTLMKVVPFIIVPLLLFKDFNVANICMSSEHSSVSILDTLIIVTGLSFWGFIGVECATTPAGAVENPSKTIPRAIIFGTFCVILVYFINNLAIMGCVPGHILEKSSTPFVDAIDIVFGKNCSLIIAAITSIVCIGTLNAWILTSAQISLGLAQDELFPKFFAKKNKANAPYISVLICCFGMIPILLITKNDNLSQQITLIIDFSVKTFLFVYLACCLAFLKLILREKNIKKIILGIFSSVFCIIMILESSLESLVIASLFTFSGIFFYPFIKKNKIVSKKT